MKLKKKDLAERIAMKQGISQKQTLAFLDTFMEAVKEEVCKGNSIELLCFGTFYLWKRTAHISPKRISERADEDQQRISLGFRPGQLFRESINDQLQDFEDKD